MLKIGLVYGTEFDDTKRIGSKISTAILNYGLSVQMLSAEQTDASTLKSLDVIILGAPTTKNDVSFEGLAALETSLLQADLSNKTIALYGLGDQRLYPDSFLDSMASLYRSVSGRGAKLVGRWPVIGYSFTQSKALSNDGKMLFGLALDPTNQSSLTDFRIANWVAYIMQEVERFSTVEELLA